MNFKEFLVGPYPAASAEGLKVFCERKSDGC
jgi:hypothetical protein